MKIILNAFLLFMVLLAGCKKNDGRYPDDIALVRVPYVNVKTDITGNAAILVNPTVFNGKYTVSLLYPNDIKPDKVDLVVIKNGDKSSVKLLQAGITTFPSTYNVTAAQLETLFGAPIKLGDNYDIGADIYLGENKYEAFPLGTGVTAYGGTGQANQPGFQPTTRFSAICSYDPSIYQGNFVVVSDAFGSGLKPGNVVTLTQISNSSFSFIYPHPSMTGQLPVIVSVNTGNNITSIASQKVGTMFFTFNNPNFAASGLTNNFVAPCVKEVTLNITYSVTEGSFGTFALRLRKQ